MHERWNNALTYLYDEYITAPIGIRSLAAIAGRYLQDGHSTDRAQPTKRSVQLGTN